MKVICAGLQKTGTKSMAEALRILGYNVHDVFDQYFLDIDLWSKVRQNTATQEDYKRVLKDVDAVTDYPACALWEEIYRAFPKAKVILMERSSEDEWFRSLVNHCKKTYDKRIWERVGIPHNFIMLFMGPTNHRYMAHSRAFQPGCTATVDMEEMPMEALARAKYRQHNSYVKAICPEKQLLVYNVKEGWGPLCEFLDQPIPDVPFPFLNKDADIIDKVANCQHNDHDFMKTVYRECSIRFTILLLFVILLLHSLIQYLGLNTAVSTADH